MPSMPCKNVEEKHVLTFLIYLAPDLVFSFFLLFVVTVVSWDSPGTDCHDVKPCSEILDLRNLCPLALPLEFIHGNKPETAIECDKTHKIL